jgi:excisionase family DNA binding protein
MDTMWLSVKQTSKYLNVSEMTVRRMLKGNKIRGIKIGSDWRVDAKFLANVIDRLANVHPHRPEGRL